MEKKPDENLIPLAHCLNRLKMPGSKIAATRATVYNYIEKLEVKVRLRKDGPGNEKAFVTPEDCDRIHKEFERTHWRAFREAKRKGK